MTNEFVDLLRSVMKEELTPINERLDTIDQNLKDLKEGQEKYNKTIVQSLGDLTEKITDNVDHKFEALNKRVFAVETEIQRLTRV